MKPSPEAPPLQVRDLDVDLAGRAVLRGVNVDVRAGELVALLGANGSGKSTLVRAAVGLVPRREGSVRLFGTSLSDFTDRRRLGYVPQRAAPASGVPASVREVVLSGRVSRRRFLGPSTRADRLAVEEAVERVGLSDRLRTPMTELSGGQQQRVLIARALVGEPDLLVMDEPTAGVDLASTIDLAGVLGDFIADGGAVLLVEHELGPLRPIVSRAVVLDHGRVTFSGDASGLPAEEHGHAHSHTGEPARLTPVPGEGVI